MECYNETVARPFLLVICDRFERDPPSQPEVEEASSSGASNIEDLNFFNAENSRKIPEERKVTRKSSKPHRKETIAFASFKPAKRSYHDTMPETGMSPSRKRGMINPEPVTNSMQFNPSSFSRLVEEPELKSSKSLAKVGFTGIAEPSHKAQAMFSKKKAHVRSSNSFHSHVPTA